MGLESVHEEKNIRINGYIMYGHGNARKQHHVRMNLVVILGFRQRGCQYRRIQESAVGGQRVYMVSSYSLSFPLWRRDSMLRR